MGPFLTGLTLLFLVQPFMSLGWTYIALFLWALPWAIWGHIASKGYPRRWARRLTPNFFASLDFAGWWRIFQRKPPQTEDCRYLLKELLEDRRRLPASLTPGLYRTLTHDTILGRLERMDNVAILSSSPAYVATLEATIAQATGNRCRHCTERCPFPGRKTPRQFYDVRFCVMEGDEGKEEIKEPPRVGGKV